MGPLARTVVYSIGLLVACGGLFYSVTPSDSAYSQKLNEVNLCGENVQCNQKTFPFVWINKRILSYLVFSQKQGMLPQDVLEARRDKELLMSKLRSEAGLKPKKES